MTSDLLLLFLGFGVGCFVTYKLMSDMKNNPDTNKRSLMPPKGFLRPKSWDQPDSSKSSPNKEEKSASTEYGNKPPF